MKLYPWSIKDTRILSPEWLKEQIWILHKQSFCNKTSILLSSWRLHIPIRLNLQRNGRNIKSAESRSTNASN